MRRCMAVGGTDFGRYDRICARLQEVNFVFAATADMPRASSSRMQNSLWTMQISFVSISPGSKTRIFLGWPQRCQYRQDGCCLSRYCTAKRKCKKRTGLDFSSPVLIALMKNVLEPTTLIPCFCFARCFSGCDQKSGDQRHRSKREHSHQGTWLAFRIDIRVGFVTPGDQDNTGQSRGP